MRWLESGRWEAKGRWGVMGCAAFAVFVKLEGQGEGALTFLARVAELAYAPDLGSGSERNRGSSPLSRNLSENEGLNRDAAVCLRAGLRVIWQQIGNTVVVALESQCPRYSIAAAVTV